MAHPVLLTYATCDAVRAAIGVDVDATILPDATILLDQFAGAAQAEVYRRDPLIDTRTSDELNHEINAAQLLCAALLLLRLPRLTQVRFGGQTSPWYQRQFESLPDQIRNLRAEAAQEINLVLAAGDVTAQRPAMFRLAAGRRGA